MIAFPFQLIPAADVIHPIAAWFLAGDDPSSWLADLLRTSAPLETARLYVIPRSIGDRRPCGALFVPAGEAAAPPSPRAMPYGLLAGKLYIPADARLDRPVSDGELRQVCPWTIALLHPGAGLIGLDEADALRASDLLAPPQRRSGRWDAAHPGIRLNQRLASVEPDAPPTLERILEQSQDDIDTKPHETLPPTSGEISTGASSQARRWIERQVARGVLHWTQKVPTGATEPTWIDRVEQWALSRIEAMGSKLEISQANEILRLLKLLENDPDEGLQYALPLTSLNSRGLAAASGHLWRRNPKFDLAALGGGERAAPWGVASDVFAHLQWQYRETANRELNLGRYRRAAYVFAHLLGDFAAAAGALKRGGHYREAAVLYNDKLGRPLEAARCLEEGGLWAEAIVPYTRLRMFEKAGELHERLGQPEEAQAAFRRAIEQHILQRDPLAAAAILANRLHLPDEALELLAAEWPHSDHAVPCLCARFALLGKLGRHPESRRLIEEVQESSLSSDLSKHVADVLADTATGYPDETTRHAAADAARVTIGNRIPQAKRNEVKQLMHALGRLAPEDRLLTRDTQRFVNTMPKPAKQPVPSARSSDWRLAHLVAETHLHKNVHWQIARADIRTGSFYAAGLDREHPGVWLARIVTPGDSPQFTMWQQPVHPDSHILLETMDHPENEVLMGIAGHGFFLHRQILAATSNSQLAGQASTPPWIPSRTCGWCCGDSGTIWVVGRDDDSILLGNYTQSGKLNFTSQFRIPDGEQWYDPNSRLPVVTHREFVCLGHRNKLVIRKGQKISMTRTPERVVHLAACSPHARPRIAIAMESGVAVLWNPGTKTGTMHTLASDLQNPVVTFTPRNQLITADATQGRVYESREGHMSCQGEFEVKGGQPISAVSFAGGFALLTSNGTVSFYRFKT